MPILPLELLGRIADEMGDDPDTLFTLRLVSETFKQIATPGAFRIMFVEDCVDSAEAVLSLMNCDESTTGSVRKLAFLGGEKCRVHGARGCSEEGIDALIAVFSALANFPKLSCLDLHFHEVYEEDCQYGDMPWDPSHFLRLQLGIFDALATKPLPPTLKALLLKNIIPIWARDDIYHREDFRAIFRSLETLEISDIPTDFHSVRCEILFRDFWEANVAAMIRSAASLVSLTIRSHVGPVGVYPALSFENTHLPHLSKLVLHSFTLEELGPTHDVFEFIVRHKNSLTHLELHDCSIGSEEPTGYNSAPRQHSRLWCAVFEQFATELDRVSKFVFERASELEEGDFPYTAFCSEDGEYRFEDGVGDRDRDRAALESFQAIVDSRRDCS